MKKELIIRSGELLSDTAEVLVNTVNTVGVMGKGIALQFKKAFPKNFTHYQEICKTGQLRPGGLLHFKETSIQYGKKLIINMATKDHWRNPSEYVYITKGLKLLKAWLNKSNADTIAMPALGCGNGGLDWDIVQMMISEELTHVRQKIIVYEPIK